LFANVTTTPNNNVLAAAMARLIRTMPSMQRLQNLPALRKIGFTANRRLLDVQTVSHDCSIGEDGSPVEVHGQRASALRFGDPRSQALFTVLGLFGLQLRGFTNQEIRGLLVPLLGFDPAHYPVGKMTSLPVNRALPEAWHGLPFVFS
jgi:hypothetical protein